MEAEALLREGRLDESLRKLEEAVRKAPADPKLRVFLFQILCVRGDWERALTQLNVAADMDPSTLLMAQVCRPALACEVLRARIFAGERTPLVMGQPAEWLGWIVQANQLTAAGKHREAEDLRARALEAAPATPGSIDGTPFEWIADADSRLGPVVEAIVEGKYYWVPFCNIRSLRLDKPADLRDIVWAPVTFQWASGGESVGFIPARYPGSEASPEGAVRLARRTEWTEAGSQTYLGLGQRMFATDQGEYGLLQTRAVNLDVPAAGEGGDG